MTLLTRKKDKPANVEDPSHWEGVGKFIRRGRGKALKLVLELEARPTMAPETPPQLPDVKELAMSLLNGIQLETPSALSPHRLVFARLELQAHDLALELAAEREQVASLALGLRNRERLGPEWRGIQHARSEYGCKLQALNRRAYELAAEIRGIAHTLTLPCEFPLNPQILLGLGHENCGATHEFLRTAISEGIVTVGEIAMWRGDTERKIKDEFGL